ncbi:hypothetical protein [Pseudoflavonifractor phocaeensis]|uniref:hypothetical protein n=1 Tax=Pseudoflavonifractor phocaeensis TaxID=1870988 RepID=UPI00210E7759|nr:hypothetical protein [Pseudoflavonifractor phocaeensis]MCQ4862740.1 hypothetical protein [Pseudoflavonifractor phocaeensis]
MTDEEILQAMQKMLAPLKEDINGIKVMLDIDVRRDINLLSEGQEQILERLPDPADLEAVEARLSAVEAVVRVHSKKIQELKKAQ